MKSLAIISTLALAGCSHPAPAPASGWQTSVWRYSLNGKPCADIVRLPEKRYQVNLLNDREQAMFSTRQTLDSDAEMEKFVEGVCGKR